MSKIETVIKVKALKRILKRMSREKGYLIRVSPSFVRTFDARVREEFLKAISRMEKSNRKTLMEQDAI